MQLSHRVTAVAVAALLLIGGLAGCSSSGDGSDSSSVDRSTSGAEGGGLEVPAGKAGFDNTAKPVVKGTFDSPAAPGATVDIAILGLKAKGKLATLHVQMVPHLPEAESRRLNPYGLNGDRGLDTSLIDPVNLKRYVVVKDSTGRELQTDDVFTRMTNDQPSHLYYTFAAPPENVKAIDVQIGSWPTFRDIPVTR